MQPVAGRRTGRPGDDLDGRLAALEAEVRRARADATARRSAAERAPERRPPLMAASVVGAVAIAGAAMGLALSESGTRPGPTAPPARGAAAPTLETPSTVAPTTVAPTTGAPTTAAPHAPSPTAPSAPGAGAPRPAAQVLVQPGDSFWSIARSVETSRLGSTPAIDRIARYWSRLVSANLSRLAVAGDPDDLFPGQVLVLPD